MCHGRTVGAGSDNVSGKRPERFTRFKDRASSMWAAPARGPVLFMGHEIVWSCRR